MTYCAGAGMVAGGEPAETKTAKTTRAAIPRPRPAGMPRWIQGLLWRSVNGRLSGGRRVLPRKYSSPSPTESASESPQRRSPYRVSRGSRVFLCYQRIPAGSSARRTGVRRGGSPLISQGTSAPCRPWPVNSGGVPSPAHAGKTFARRSLGRIVPARRAGAPAGHGARRCSARTGKERRAAGSCCRPGPRTSRYRLRNLPGRAPGIALPPPSAGPRERRARPRGA